MLAADPEKIRKPGNGKTRSSGAAHLPSPAGHQENWILASAAGLVAFAQAHKQQRRFRPDMKPSTPGTTVRRLLCPTLLAVALAACGDAPQDKTSPTAATKPALTVTTITPQLLDWPQTLKASGNIAAWQEAVIGPEISNYRITEIHANVGDQVKRGELLARIASDTVQSELAENRATVAEAEATLSEARANSERAALLREKGFYSAQQGLQTQTAADTALARLNAAKARLQSAELKRSKAAVLAPDDGIISARTATVGTLTQPGQELFRLIRGGRLEWRAEVTAAEISKLAPGQTASLNSPNNEVVEGVIRAVAPTVDPQTRIGLVYVDIPASASQVLGAGMFARGEFRLGQRPALTLPQSAILLREGFSYVFRVNGDKLTQTKIGIGRRNADRVEVSGLDAAALVVSDGVGFLADGDTVRIVAAR
jgi:RND family efflux transporter MFP subunit